MRKQLIYVLLGFILLPHAAKAGSVDWAKLNPELSDATYVNEDSKCMDCHEEYMINYEKTIHAKAFKYSSRPGMKATDCENCHGPASKHLDAPKKIPRLIVSFKPQDGHSPQQLSSICNQCHEKGLRMNWQGSPHEMAGISCSQCHYVMEKRSKKELFISEDPKASCAKCHEESRAKLMRSSHMPLREGNMDCASCHNPHGGSGPSQLKEASVNETCYLCHADKRGPFLWEHPPVMENCTNCHDPHGSNIEAMLKIKVPYLCQTCHAAQDHPSVLYSGTGLPGGAPAPQLLGKGCLNCHSQVHGSKHPSGARLQR